jgi:hypothetical protein
MLQFLFLKATNMDYTHFFFCTMSSSNSLTDSEIAIMQQQTESTHTWLYTQGTGFHSDLQQTSKNNQKDTHHIPLSTNHSLTKTDATILSGQKHTNKLIHTH